MPSELALHAYVFLGNALHYLLNGVRLDYAASLGTTRGELVTVYEAIEPLTPANIVEEIGSLPSKQRELLVRSAQWTVDHLGTEFSTLTGVTEAEAREVLAWLEGTQTS